MKILQTLIFVSLLFTGACSREPAPRQLPDFESLVKDQYITAFKSGDVDHWINLFTEDAVGMHNTLPALVSKSAIREFGDMVAQNLTIEQMDVTVDEVRVNGTWALTRGSFISKFVPNNIEDSSGIAPQQGKFILLWEEQEDGEWKIILDMGNSNQPSQTPES